MGRAGSAPLTCVKPKKRSAGAILRSDSAALPFLHSLGPSEFTNLPCAFWLIPWFLCFWFRQELEEYLRKAISEVEAWRKGKGGEKGNEQMHLKLVKEASIARCGCGCGCGCGWMGVYVCEEDAGRYGVGLEWIVLRIVLVGGGMKSGEGEKERCPNVQRVCLYRLLGRVCSYGCTHAREVVRIRRRERAGSLVYLKILVKFFFYLQEPRCTV
jgi:hypothetical protein